jgi:hypothetical protein
MASVRQLNPKAEVLGRGAACFMNVNAGEGQGVAAPDHAARCTHLPLPSRRR